MAKDMARFTKGASEKSTRYLGAENVIHDGKSSMGMPGFIRTKQDASDGGLTSGKPVGQRFTRGKSMRDTVTTAPTGTGNTGSYIGKKGPSMPGAKFDAGKFRGSSDKSYRATSMTAPGKIKNGSELKPSMSNGEKEGPKRDKPTKAARMYGGSSRVSFPSQGATAGKMESLRGKARFSMEK